MRSRLLTGTAAIVAVTALGCTTAGPHRPQTLGSIVRLSVPGADNRGATIAANGSRVAVVWAAVTQASTNVYAAVSLDAGRTFAEPVRVNDLEGDVRSNGEQPPRVAIGSDITVIWQSRLTGQSRVRMSRSADNGRTFQPAVTVHEEPLTGARGWASVALDDQGRTHVAWLDGRNAGAHVHGSPMRQDIFSASIPPVDLAQGKPLDRGKSANRQEASVATDVCFCCKTGIATAGDKDVFVAWRHVYPVNMRDMAVARSTDGGATFSSPVRVSEDGWQIASCPEDGPAIVAGNRSDVHIAWPTMTQGGSSQKAIFYTASVDGGKTFAPRVRLSQPEAGVAAHPQIAKHGSSLYVVWDEFSSSGRRIQLLALPADTTRAPDKGRLVIAADGTPTYPGVAVASGAVVVAWTDSRPESSTISVRRVE